MPFTLLPGEVISSAQLSIVLLWGVDPVPDLMREGNPVISGGDVTFALARGVAGNIYKATITANLTSGRILTNSIGLEVF